MSCMGGYGLEALCPGGTLILVISRGVQLYYGIAQRWGTNQIRGMR